MPTYERLSVVPFELKSYNPGDGIFVGLASTPQVDRSGEVVSSEAMREAAERYMRNPVITFAHDTWEPIGRGLSVNVTDAGTLLEAYVTDKTERGQMARGLLEDKILRSLSIGFNPYSRSYGPHPDGSPDYELVAPSEKPAATSGYGYGPWFSENADTLVWKRIDWMETAVCAIPCNPGASIQLAKSLGLSMPDLRETQDPEEARFLADVERIRTGAESVRNIARHWRKSGGALSPEQIERLLAAHQMFAELLPEPYPEEQAVREALAATKAGRVLSSTNRSAVEGAITALQEVLSKDDASRGTGDADSDDGKGAAPCALRLPEPLALQLPQTPRLSLPV